MGSLRIQLRDGEFGPPLPIGLEGDGVDAKIHRPARRGMCWRWVLYEGDQRVESGLACNRLTLWIGFYLGHRRYLRRHRVRHG